MASMFVISPRPSRWLLCVVLTWVVGCREFPEVAARDASPDSPEQGADAGPHESMNRGDGGDDDTDGTAPVFDLQVEATKLELVAGGTVDVPITLVRESDAAVDVQVLVTGLPDGVTASDLTIAGDQSAGSVQLTASDTAQLARLTTVAISTLPRASHGERHFDLYVRGKPGTVDTTFGQNGAAAPGSALKYRNAIEVVALPDDKLLVLANEDIDVLGTNITVLRVTGDGAIDRDFGIDGEYSFAREYGVGPPQTYGSDLLVRANGDLVIVGDWRTSDEHGPFITALTSNGRRAPEFVQPPFEGQTFVAWRGVAESQATLPMLLAVGYQMEIPLVGMFDNELAPHGESNPYTGIINAGLGFVFWDPVANKFIAGGGYESKSSITQLSYFGETESLDGQDPLRMGPGSLQAGAVDEDGRYYFVGGISAWELTRYVRAGLSGSDKGELSFKKDDLGPEGDGAYGLTISNGRLHVVGTNKNVAKTEMHAVLGRYSLDLERDDSFGDHGLLTLEPALSPSWGAVAVTAQSDGRLVVALINAANDLVLYRVWN